MDKTGFTHHRIAEKNYFHDGVEFDVIIIVRLFLWGWVFYSRESAVCKEIMDKFNDFGRCFVGEIV